MLSLVLVAHFLFGPGAAWTAGGLSFAAFALLWYALPLERRMSNRNPDREPSDGDDGTGWAECPLRAARA